MWASNVNKFEMFFFFYFKSMNQLFFSWNNWIQMDFCCSIKITFHAKWPVSVSVQIYVNRLFFGVLTMNRRFFRSKFHKFLTKPRVSVMNSSQGFIYHRLRIEPQANYVLQTCSDSDMFWRYDTVYERIFMISCLCSTGNASTFEKFSIHFT